MLFSQGPESFFAAQKQVGVILEEQFYPSFIVSDTYYLLAASMREVTASDEDSVASGRITFKCIWALSLFSLSLEEDENFVF